MEFQYIRVYTWNSLFFPITATNCTWLNPSFSFWVAGHLNKFLVWGHNFSSHFQLLEQFHLSSLGFNFICLFFYSCLIQISSYPVSSCPSPLPSLTQIKHLTLAGVGGAGSALTHFLLPLPLLRCWGTRKEGRGSGLLVWWLTVRCCSVTQLCPALCDPMDCSTPDLLVPQHLPEFAQLHFHCISDAVQPSHPLMPSSPTAFNLSQHLGLLQWIVCFHQMAQILELQLQHQSFQWIFRVDLT